MGHDGVASGYLTPTSFHRLTGCQRDPRDRGVTLGLHNSACFGRSLDLGPEKWHA